MAQPTLASYIRTQLSAGYSMVSIREHLVTHGYSAKMVDDAIQNLYKGQKHPIHTLNKTLIVSASLIFVGLIILATSVYFLFGSNKESGQLLDVKIKGITEQVHPGDSFQFRVDLANMGGKNRYDVRLKHELLRGETVITMEEETVAVETTMGKVTSIKIPDTVRQDSYILRTTAIYSGKKAVSSLSLRIEDEPAVVERTCPASCDDSNSCTIDACNASTNFRCLYTPIIPCCGDNNCQEGEDSGSCPGDCPLDEENDTGGTPSLQRPISDFREELEKIKSIAISDSSRAGDMCKEFEKQVYQDHCYGEVAKISNMDGFCRAIKDADKKDSCLLNHILDNHNYELCTEIVNDNLRSSCSMLSP